MAASTTAIKPPHGLDAIIEAFGDPRDLFPADGGPPDPVKVRAWQQDILVPFTLPFPIPLSMREPNGKAKSTLWAHRKVGPLITSCLAQVVESGLRPEIKSWGGCFAARKKRTSDRISTHAWAIAIDLNPEDNALGTVGKMHPRVIEIFERAGFTWGGRWKTPDPMHFQFCSGY